MPDPTPDPVEIDLETMIANCLDERGLTKENMEKLGMLDSLTDSINESLGNLFKANKPAKQKEFDSDGLTAAIGNLIDEKLKGLNVQTGTKKSGPGPLGRFLFGNPASD